MAAGAILSNGKLTRQVVITCFIAAAGGLIFGYDIGISGGVTSMAPFLKKFFHRVYRREELTNFTSSLYLAALVASLVAAPITKKMGRKWSMVARGLLFLAGALINGAAQNVAMLIIGRVLLGFGVGFADD